MVSNTYGSGWNMPFTHTAIATGNWYHAVVVFTSSTARMYLNGADLGTKSVNTSSISYTQTVIGGMLYNNGYRFEGLIEDVAVFDTELSAADVTAIYNSGAPADLNNAASYDTDRTSNLKGYWRMGDDLNDTATSGGSIATITDSSGNGNDMVQATASKQPTFKALAQSTTSLSFDGSNDYLDLASFTPFDLKGLSLWVKPDHVTTYNSSGIDYIIGLGDYDEGLFLSGDLSSRLTDEVIGFAGAAGNYLWGYSGQGVSISTDWHHIAVTWNTSNSSTNSGNEGYDIYLDGVNVGNDYGTWHSGNGVPFSCDFVRIGAKNRSGVAGYKFGGGLDDVAVFNTALSASEVASLAASREAHIVNDLSLSPVAYYRMGEDDSLTDGASASQITDASGNGNHATQATAANQPTASVDPVIYV